MISLINSSNLLYFIEYNAHANIVPHLNFTMIFGKKPLFYFSRIISQELIIASLFIADPFSATFHV